MHAPGRTHALTQLLPLMVLVAALIFVGTPVPAFAEQLRYALSPGYAGPPADATHSLCEAMIAVSRTHACYVTPHQFSIRRRLTDWGAVSDTTDSLLIGSLCRASASAPVNDASCYYDPVGRRFVVLAFSQEPLGLRSINKLYLSISAPLDFPWEPRPDLTC